MRSIPPINTPLLVNRYRLLQTLGAGGFGETFLAEDTHLPSRRRCVIKRLIPVTNSPQLAQQVQQRFEREAVILEQLGEAHPQIPSLYAYFEAAGQYYLVQEWIDGVTLTQQVQTGGVLPAASVRDLLLSILPVLEFVHSKQMVHRDIKPDNIIIRQRDAKPVLIDFGAVKEAMGTAVNAYGNSAQTVAIGTPGYMPSEQAAGRPTYASDLYALGLVAIYLLTGKAPQELPTDPRTSELLWRQAAPQVDSQLADVIDRAIRFQPGDRFQSAREMLNALNTSQAPAVLPIPAPVPSAPVPLPTVATQVVSPGQAVPAAQPTASPQAVAPPAAVIRSPKREFSLFKWIAVGLAVGVGVAAFGAIRTLISNPRLVDSDRSPVRQEQPSPSQANSPSESVASQTEPQTETDQIIPSPISQTPPAAPASRNDRSPEPAEVVGFPVGTSERTIRSQLGEPTVSTQGFWPNTRALRYEEYVPGEVTLGYLFDDDTGELRQTEAAFAQSAGLAAMQQTIDQMLANSTPAKVQQGLQQVYDRQINQYDFAIGDLEGVIQRNDRDRIYIGVWDADLH